MSTYFLGTSEGSNRQFVVQKNNQELYEKLGTIRRCEKMFGKRLTICMLLFLIPFTSACRKERLEKPEVRIARFKKQLREDPNDTNARIALGQAYVDKEMLGPAIEEFRKATEIDSTHFQAFHKLGVTLRKLDRYDEALRALEKAIQLDSLSASAYNSLGLVYYQTQQKQEALSQFHKAIRIDPGCAEAHYNLGALYRELKDYEKATHHWQKYSELQR